MAFGPEKAEFKARPTPWVVWAGTPSHPDPTSPRGGGHMAKRACELGRGRTGFDIGGGPDLPPPV